MPVTLTFPVFDERIVRVRDEKRPLLDTLLLVANCAIEPFHFSVLPESDWIDLN